MNAIEIDNIRKVFYFRGGFRHLLSESNNANIALDGISVNIKEGEIFGLLGPNGAGKTTLIKILSTLILPTSGTAKIYGHDILRDEIKVKKLIGLIHSDERSFFWRLTGRQNLDFFASLFNLPGKSAERKIDELLYLVELEQDADKKFHFYSTGMKQKLAIARGLLVNPKILFMDEALRSIDPISTRQIRQFIKHQIVDIVGGTVVIATHRLDEAAELCDRIAIVHKGKMLACGSKDELAAYYKRPIQYELEVRNMSSETLNHLDGLKPVLKSVITTQLNGNLRIILHFADEEEELNKVLSEIINNKGLIQKCSRTEPSLESIFYDILKSTDVIEHEKRNA
jgi:ABC-2 type transport system ATP-binding protein